MNVWLFNFRKRHSTDFGNINTATTIRCVSDLLFICLSIFVSPLYGRVNSSVASVTEWMHLSIYQNTFSLHGVLTLGSRKIWNGQRWKIKIKHHCSIHWKGKKHHILSTGWFSLMGDTPWQLPISTWRLSADSEHCRQAIFIIVVCLQFSLFSWFSKNFTQPQYYSNY